MQVIVTAGGHSVQLSITDPAQVAALEVTRLRAGAPSSEAYLTNVVMDWAAANTGATAEDIRNTALRALASYADQVPPEVVVNESEPTVDSLLAYAAHRRWQFEVSGTTWNGRGVHTDRESQTKMLAAYVQLGAGLRQDPSPWKLKDGYVNATNAQMAEIIGAALAHVNNAFDIEHDLEAGIKAVPPAITTKAQIDAAFN